MTCGVLEYHQETCKSCSMLHLYFRHLKKKKKESGKKYEIL